MLHLGESLGLRAEIDLIECRRREGQFVEPQLAGALVAGCLIPYCPSLRERHGQIRAHPDILAALTGEHEGDLAIHGRIE